MKSRPPERLPVLIRNVYADLVDRAWTGGVSEMMVVGGTP